MISKYSFDLKETDDEYEVEGVRFPDMESVLMRDFGFCGCGDPEAVLDFIYGGLTQCQKFHNQEITFKERNDWFISEGIMYFFLYWADKEKLTEHGGSVGGSWLSQKGINLIYDYEIYKQNEY